MSMNVQAEVAGLVALLAEWLPPEHAPQYQRDLLALAERVRAEEREALLARFRELHEANREEAKDCAADQREYYSGKALAYGNAVRIIEARARTTLAHPHQPRHARQAEETRRRLEEK